MYRIIEIFALNCTSVQNTVRENFVPIKKLHAKHLLQTTRKALIIRKAEFLKGWCFPEKSYRKGWKGLQHLRMIVWRINVSAYHR